MAAIGPDQKSVADPPIGMDAAEQAKAASQGWKVAYSKLYCTWRLKHDAAEDKFKAGDFWGAAAEWREAASVPTPQEPVDELANVRAVAKEWLAAALTLFGLFSFTTIFFGQDALDQLAGHGALTFFFLFFGVLAVAAAALAIGTGTRAAHGWPDKSRGGSWNARGLVGRPKQERAADDNTAKKIECARDDLKSSVAFLGATLVLTVAAVGMIVGARLAGPNEVDLLNAEGERVACGVVVDFRAGADGQPEVSVRPENDDAVKWYKLDKVTTIKAKKCP